MRWMKEYYHCTAVAGGGKEKLRVWTLEDTGFRISAMICFLFFCSSRFVEIIISRLNGWRGANWRNQRNETKRNQRPDISRVSGNERARVATGSQDTIEYTGLTRPFVTSFVHILASTRCLCRLQCTLHTDSTHTRTQAAGHIREFSVGLT